MGLSLRCRIDHEVDGNIEAIDLRTPVGVVETWEIDEVPQVISAAEMAAQQGLFAAGFVTYEAASAFDEALVARPSSRADGPQGLPLAWFGLFEKSVAVSPDTRPLPSLFDQGRSPQDGLGVVSTPSTFHQTQWLPEITSEEHAIAVGKIRAGIAAGDVYLVNLTTRFRRCWESAEDPFVLYEQLTSGHKGGLHVYLETPEWAVACGSPELFFELAGHDVLTRPMKGTAPRGRWPQEDQELSSALAASPKERAENVMVVDLLRNDLGRIAVAGSVKVPALWQVERHPSVWQLTSTVTATSKPDVGLAQVFGALFPSGSVTGAPKVAAMEAIASLETSGRGLYCGAIGLLQPTTNNRTTKAGVSARFAVAIRTAIVDKKGLRAEYGSGGGVTWDSDEANEWKEVNIKVQSLTSPAPIDASLLETMAFSPSFEDATKAGEIRNLDRHLARLTASASYFEIPVPTDMRTAIADELVGRSTESKVRLLLSFAGALEIEISDLIADYSSEVIQTVCVDLEPVWSTDPALFHKTTARERYEARRARHPHADDVLLVNQHGEITETTRANLVFLKDERWWTPPLRCGLLPGVERARLLATGVLGERAITVNDIGDVQDLATVSSLRGWRPARLQTMCSGPVQLPLESVN
jgi:para-aminobenzoate synthetase / 4-amino-4-deoxychorismate lyase